MLPTYVLSIVFAASPNAVTTSQQTPPSVGILPDPLDCAYRPSPFWLDSLRESVARGETADPAKREPAAGRSPTTRLFPRVPRTSVREGGR
jgi:hypothetical protein